jgi:hypothetical protein
MLWLLQVPQQIAPALPPIQVTVQSVPGTPEWIKILISTLAGASVTFGFEYLKPWIAKKRLRKTMIRQLGIELVDSLTHVDGALIAIRRAAANVDLRRKGLVLASLQLAMVRSDRFTFYYSEERPALFDIDPAKRLIHFYMIVKENLGTIRIADAVKQEDFDKVTTFLVLASSIGSEYVKAQMLTYAPDLGYVEKALES